MEEVLARRLAAEIESELASLSALGEELANAPRQDDIYSLRARGSILHDFYNGVERVFVRIAPVFNGGISRGDQWDRDLVDDMTLDIAEVRPAVIDRGLARTRRVPPFSACVPECLRRRAGSGANGLPGKTAARDSRGISRPRRNVCRVDAGTRIKDLQACPPVNTASIGCPDLDCLEAEGPSSLSASE